MSSFEARETSLNELSLKLQHLYKLVLQAERAFSPSPGGLPLLHKLVNDPAWAWLRPLSSLISEIDHALARASDATASERATVAAHVRGLLFGEGDLVNESFLSRYRALLQSEPALASAHGELKGLMRTFPQESENESERLHARHQWAMRCKHRATR